VVLTLFLAGRGGEGEVGETALLFNLVVVGDGLSCWCVSATTLGLCPRFLPSFMGRRPDLCSEIP
jgi:hypothetical protein